MTSRARALLAELLGTAVLVTSTVTSMITASAATSQFALALFINAAVTGAVLYVLILIFAPISGAHFNPAVSIVMYVRRAISASILIAYIAAQLAGAILGIIIANVLTKLDAVSISVVARTGSTLWISEVIATAGLVGIIVGLVVTNKSSFIPAGVGAWVFAAILFTPSTSFANPAVTFGRIFTSSGSGISPSSTIGFFIAQLIGAGIGAATATAICKEDK